MHEERSQVTPDMKNTRVHQVEEEEQEQQEHD
jgi:hypothetical protein